MVDRLLRFGPDRLRWKLVPRGVSWGRYPSRSHPRLFATRYSSDLRNAFAASTTSTSEIAVSATVSRT